MWTLDTDGAMELRVFRHPEVTILSLFLQKAPPISPLSSDSFLKVWDPDFGTSENSQKCPPAHAIEAQGPWDAAVHMEISGTQGLPNGDFVPKGGHSVEGMKTCHLSTSQSNSKKKGPMKGFYFWLLRTYTF